MKYFRYIFVFFCFSIHAQDVLYLHNNTKLEVKLLEIAPQTIKYKSFSNPDGPDYIISKSDVALIMFKNGEHLVISQPVQKDPARQFIDEYWRRKDSIQKMKISKRTNKFNRYTSSPNIVFCNLPEFANIGIGIDYLREFKGHLLLFYGSLSATAGLLLTEDNSSDYGFYYTSEYKNKTRPFTATLGLLLNCSGKRFVTYNVGPGIRFGQYTGGYNEIQSHKIYPDSTSSNYYYYEYTKIPHSFVVNTVFFQLDNHILIKCSEKINVMVYANLTVYRTFDYLSGHPKNYLSPNYNFKTQGFNNGFPFSNSQFGISVGYRFGKSISMKE